MEAYSAYQVDSGNWRTKNRKWARGFGDSMSLGTFALLATIIIQQQTSENGGQKESITSDRQPLHATLILTNLTW